MSKADNICAYVMKKKENCDPEYILNSIDDFCKDNNAMVIGNVRGIILDDEVIKHKPKRVLEIGTYCGYSTIRIARLLTDEAHLVTLEINPANIVIAKKLVDKCGLTNKITFVNSNLETYIDTLEEFEPFDLIFIDHWSRCYLADFRLLETYELIKEGSVIIANNVLHLGITDYKNYMIENMDYDNVCHDTWLNIYGITKDEIMVSTKKKTI